VEVRSFLCTSAFMVAFVLASGLVEGLVFGWVKRNLRLDALACAVVFVEVRQEIWTPDSVFETFACACVLVEVREIAGANNLIFIAIASASTGI
jgi:hypothetical protein